MEYINVNIVELIIKVKIHLSNIRSNVNTV